MKRSNRLRVKEAAAWLGLTRQRVVQLIHAGEIAAEKEFDLLWTISPSDLNRFRARKRPTGIHRENR